MARDISGNGNHGRISGAEWQRDKPASSLLFRFSPNNFVEIGSSPSLHIRGDTTYMVWGWVESFPLEQIATLFSTNVSSKPSLLLRVYALGPVFWEMYDKAGNRIYMSQDVGLKPGWHHFALVRQGKTGYFYLDGELKNQTTNSRLGDTSLDAPIFVGNDPRKIYPFQGKLKEFRVYRGALTAEEVSRWYREQKPEIVGP